MITDCAHCLDGGQRLLGIFEMAPIRRTGCAIEQDARQSAACIKAGPLVPHIPGVRGLVFHVAARKLNEVA